MDATCIFDFLLIAMILDKIKFSDYTIPMTWTISKLIKE